MSIPSQFYTFQDGTSLITAERLNKNWDELYKMFNPALVGIAEDNIANTSKILVSDRDYIGVDAKITGTWEFAVFPTVPDASIPDAALSSNIPHKDTANTFSLKQTLSAGMDFSKTQAENIVVHKVSGLPGGVAADTGRIVYNTLDNKFYGWNGTSWLELSYVGGYTGGAIRGVSDFGIVDNNDTYKLWFKTEGDAPTVKLAIKGEPFPKRFYIELGYHTHAFTGTSVTPSVTDPGHTHDVVLGSHGHGSKSFSLSTHTHGVSGDTGTQSASHWHDMSNHTHNSVVAGADNSGTPNTANTQYQSASHTHTISLTTGTPSASDNVDQHDLGTKTSASGTTGITINQFTPEGTNAYAGVNIGGSLSTTQKLYGNNLSVSIDGVSVTSNILTATGWGAIGDGTGNHAFHTDGTGEMDASSWKSYTAGYHVLEITEPEDGYGCDLLVLIETS